MIINVFIHYSFHDFSNSQTCLNRIPLRQKNLFSLDRFLVYTGSNHRHLLDRTVNSVWFRQVICLLSVQFRQVFGLHRFKLHRHLVDGTVKSVWFRQDICLLSVRFRQVSLYSRGLFCSGFENINRQNKNKMR